MAVDGVTFAAVLSFVALIGVWVALPSRPGERHAERLLEQPAD